MITPLTAALDAARQPGEAVISSAISAYISAMSAAGERFARATAAALR
jgi:hypothetical protein